jgi:hypothetical protein
MFKKFKEVQSVSIDMPNNRVTICEVTITGYYIFWIRYIRVVSVMFDVKRINY